MPRNGAGTWVRNYDWTADRDSGSPNNVISADKMDVETDDMADGLTNSISKDGQTTPSADLPMGGFKHTGVATTVAVRTSYVPVAALQDNTTLFIAAGGTADALTATYVPAVTVLVNGMELCFRALLANTTTTPTFSPNALTAKAFVKGANTALVANDIAGLHHECRARYNSTTDKWHLLNPTYIDGVKISADSLNSLTTDATGGATGDFIPFVDVSDSNASNKVLTTDLFANVHANFTTKALPVPADSLMIADSAASGAAKISTVQQLFDSLTGIATDATGATGDFVLTNDISASNVAKKVALSTIQTLFAASASDQETASSAAKNVTPATQQRHPSATKASVNFTTRGTNGTATLNSAYNVASVTRTGTGAYTVAFTTAFSSANYVMASSYIDSGGTLNLLIFRVTAGTTSCTIKIISASGGGASDTGDSIDLIFTGDQ